MQLLLTFLLMKHSRRALLKILRTQLRQLQKLLIRSVSSYYLGIWCCLTIALQKYFWISIRQLKMEPLHSRDLVQIQLIVPHQLVKHLLVSPYGIALVLLISFKHQYWLHIPMFLLCFYWLFSSFFCVSSLFVFEFKNLAIDNKDGHTS